MADVTAKRVQPFITDVICPACKGARLNETSLSSKVLGYNIAEMAAMQVDELAELLRTIDDPVALPVAAGLLERLQHLVDIGLDYA